MPFKKLEIEKLIQLLEETQKDNDITISKAEYCLKMFNDFPEIYNLNFLYQYNLLIEHLLSFLKTGKKDLRIRKESFEILKNEFPAYIWHVNFLFSMNCLDGDEKDENLEIIYHSYRYSILFGIYEENQLNSLFEDDDKKSYDYSLGWLDRQEKDFNILGDDRYLQLIYKLIIILPNKNTTIKLLTKCTEILKKYQFYQYQKDNTGFITNSDPLLRLSFC